MYIIFAAALRNRGVIPKSVWSSGEYSHAYLSPLVGERVCIVSSLIAEQHTLVVVAGECPSLSVITSVSLVPSWLESDRVMSSYSFLILLIESYHLKQFNHYRARCDWQ